MLCVYVLALVTPTLCSLYLDQFKMGFSSAYYYYCYYYRYYTISYQECDAKFFHHLRLMLLCGRGGAVVNTCHRCREGLTVCPGCRSRLGYAAFSLHVTTVDSFALVAGSVLNTN